MKRTSLQKKLLFASYYAHVVLSAITAAGAGLDLWLALYLRDRDGIWFFIVILLEIACFMFGIRNIRKINLLNTIRRAGR